MRALAEFVMRGRTQAMGVSIVTACLPITHWLCSAVVCLVVLRKGLAEGLFVAMWASLPILALAVMFQNPSPVIALIVVISLAHVLRTTSSWEMTSISAVVLSALGGLVFEFAAPSAYAGVVETLMTVFTDIASQNNQAGGDMVVPDVEDMHQLLFGFLVAGYASGSLLYLMLARWWQSELYNEGGFGEEFQSLRLSPIVIAVLAIMILATITMGGFSRWLLLLIIPILVASVGFVHWFVREKEISRSWLVSFYLLLIVMSQFMVPFLAMLAMMDSLLDLRRRIRSDREV